MGNGDCCSNEEEMETACSSLGLVYWKWIIKFVSFISKKDQLDLDDSGSRRHDGDKNVSYPQARSSIFLDSLLTGVVLARFIP